MKREILFKGKRVDNGEWIKGSLQLPNTEIEETRIVSWNAVRYEVHPETVCQFINRIDKNGKKIFENDICELNVEHSYISFNGDIEDENYKYTGFIKLIPSTGFVLKTTKCFDNNEGEFLNCFPKIKFIASYRTEIIGNIHD